MDKKILGILIVSIVAMTSLSMASAFSFGEKNLGSEMNPEIREETLELRLELQNSIEGRDYESWLEAISTILSEEEFDNLVEIYEGREGSLNRFGESRGPWRNREREYRQENKLEMRPDCGRWVERLE